MTATYHGTVTDDGYGAAYFDTLGGWHSIELQVHPGKLFVYVSSHTAHRARRAVWVGEDAAAMGLAVCRGECHPHVLADWCEENLAETRDWDFDAVAWLRKTLCPVAVGADELPF